MQTNTSVTLLNTSLIIPNKYQPRKVFDDADLNSLADSIKNYGIINPILVRKKDDKYEIIAGERRFRAAKKVGLTEVPVIIKNADEQQMAQLALIENIQRQGLTPIEEAKSYEEIMRICNQTQASLAEKLGKSQSSIANKIRLLSLPQEIQDALDNKKISERHARRLIAVEDKDKQIELLNRIIKERLTVKETEKIINEKQATDEEIKQAISDIMKSLNIKEEEKEDDNMNNGNFFPNFDNNNVANNTSLNMMNMQSMNQTPVEPAPEMVMPTMAPVKETMIQPIPTVEPPIMPQQEPLMAPTTPVVSPMFDNFAPNPNPPVPTDLGVNNNLNPMAGFATPQENLVTPPMNNMETPMINDAPLFSVGKPMNQVVEPPQASVPMVDAPLFNPNVTMPGLDTLMSPVQEQNIESVQEPLITPTMPTMESPVAPEVQPVVEPTSFEIPVTNPQTTEVPVTTDKLTELQNLLTENGFNYKVYSNETDNCVIIELPKN